MKVNDFKQHCGNCESSKCNDQDDEFMKFCEELEQKCIAKMMVCYQWTPTEVFLADISQIQCCNCEDFKTGLAYVPSNGECIYHNLYMSARLCKSRCFKRALWVQDILIQYGDKLSHKKEIEKNV